MADFNLWLMLGPLISVLAWLSPDKEVPWRSFDSEWLFAASLLPLAIWVGTRPGIRSIEIPMPALAVLAAAAIPLLQGLAGQIQFRGDTFLAVLYLGASSLVIALGYSWRSRAPSSVDLGLPLTALGMALTSLCLASMQWLHVDLLGVMLVALPSNARPTGNIGQANHLGTLLAWGLIALWWLYEKRRVGQLVAISAAFLFLFGVAMTQSRTGWLHISLLVIAALALPARMNLRITSIAIFALAVSFVAIVLSWEHINTGFELTAALTVEQQASTGPRLKIWQQFAAAVAAAPWLGYGWTQGGLAQQAVLLELPPLNIVISHAHSLILDLLVWQGIPLTAAMLLASGYWAWLRVKRIKTVNTALCALALLLILIHSLLEFPHAYAYFLLPSALLIGIVEADCGTKPYVLMPRRIWLAVVVSLAATLLWLGHEYLTLRESLQKYRFESARIGNTRGSVAPNTVLLTQLKALMVFVRTPLDSSLNEVQLLAAEQAVARFPSAANQFRMAALWAHNAQTERASKTLDVLCAMQRAPTCQLALEAWQLRAEDSPKMKVVALPLARSSAN